MDNYNIEKEVWKDVEGWEGYYQVSNFGNVRSLDREIVYSTGRKELRKGQLIKPNFNKSNGYLSVGLNKGKNKKRAYVHRLVALSFCDNPHGKPEVNHRDEIKTNNHYKNLEWVTRLENNVYNGRAKKLSKKSAKTMMKKGIYERTARKKSKKVKKINPRNGEETVYKSLTEAAEMNGFDRTMISKTAKGIYKQAYGYEWELIEKHG